jgi:hypothetical protein
MTWRRKICHGRKGLVYQRYHEGMEEQLGTLGLYRAPENAH